ncbi:MULTISPECIES: SDR family oxidoreductase [Thermus]|jgi:gluconate 5-dehydrogenase|uniref:Oxidoreductase, short-chain dehydrogenase/reductase family n=1 Tax=Thermus thermophilus (strain ATCC 27634 / DSM 579 / HB8) TaxID=300852 RepID=Q53WH6_THET8|nr:SDR family oxidoreductase [Thermus thermophilus]HAH39563.1 gluconate 5-dehydrogenase [Thermus sp.]QZY59514.1 SDR family oxidoreductase [Thermus thermophilus]BAD71812.1 oxidoreductase, short-chain dehydrogenase/reductase family [Thermus thermophilus HB8]BDA38699.1 gluconate 5-dehydrogenase [Thermus thermophilus]BDE46460.1 gluconate 5-dehydrogenase [Thermus thermophilus]
MFLEKFRLDGKAALVTGGSRGLGLEAALALKEAGARVAVVARRASFFEEARKALGEDALYLEGDVRDEARLEAIAEEVEERLGPLTVLVNAAGVSWGAPSLEMPVEKVREVLEVNLVGAFLASRVAARRMKERGYGKIIHIASVAGLKGEYPEVLDAVGYSASKGGLIALTRDLAVKWGRWGIRVNALAPGFFPTRMTEKVLPRAEAFLKATLPLGRPGAPGELGGAVLFLASPASDYVTGAVLPVDGGATAL